MREMSDTCDVLIVGARCAGAATAILLARAGLDVRLVDHAPGIGDTLSTHALMRPGVAMLDRLGVLPRIVEAGTPAVTRTRFAYGRLQTVDIAVKPMGTAAGLYAPRRYLLDRLLCEAALAEGASLSLGTRFETVIRDRAGRVAGAELRLHDGSSRTLKASLVVGADGRNSHVAQAVGAGTIRRDPRRAAMVFGYFDGIPNEGYRWLFDEGLQLGLIPTTGGRHCVFAACRPSEFQERLGDAPLFGLARALSPWAPGIAADLIRSAGAERLRRFAGAPGHIRDCAGPGWALVGDAGCFMDPATAHGMTEALLDAGRLASSWIAGQETLDDYRDRRRAQVGTIFAITQRIASFDWNLDDLTALHRDLNEAMRSELADIDENLPPASLATSAWRAGSDRPAALGGGIAADSLGDLARGGIS
ncbi:MAG: FAD-dependent monooxygenase [Rhodobacteraceae bacterium]|nr:FAD-dependent monooxygenase [Paracoccaceae bacterium]MCC0067698.1 FAD-dependent monooxygenase [Rhodovulum sp.]